MFFMCNLMYTVAVYGEDDIVLGIKTFTDLDEARLWADTQDTEYGPGSSMIREDGKSGWVTRTADS